MLGNAPGEITHRDHPHHRIATHHGEMPESSEHHPVERLSHRGVGSDRHRISGHPLGDRGDPGQIRAGGVSQRPEDVALCEDAHKGAVLKHKHGPRAPRGHGTDGLHEVGRGIDRDELCAHDLFDGRQRRHPVRVGSYGTPHTYHLGQAPILEAPGARPARRAGHLKGQTYAYTLVHPSVSSPPGDPASPRYRGETTSASPTRQPTTLWRRQRPGTPLSSCSPASSNCRPEPATRSFTVCETMTSPALAIAATRAPIDTVRPLHLSSMTSHSPVCTPALTSIPRSRTRSVTSSAQRIARAGPSKEA